MVWQKCSACQLPVKTRKQYRNVNFAQYPMILLHKWWKPIWNPLSCIGILPRDAIPTKWRVESTDKWPNWCRIPPFSTEKKAPTIRQKWLDCVRRKDYVPKRYHRLCIKHFVAGRSTKHHSYRECFSIITIAYKEPNNIRPSISIQKIDKMRCQTTTCTKDSYILETMMQMG